MLAEIRIAPATGVEESLIKEFAVAGVGVGIGARAGSGGEVGTGAGEGGIGAGITSGGGGGGDEIGKPEIGLAVGISLLGRVVRLRTLIQIIVAPLTAMTKTAIEIIISKRRLMVWLFY